MNLTISLESQWNIDSNDILSVRKYYQLFTHESNTFLGEQYVTLLKTGVSAHRQTHRQAKVKTAYPPDLADITNRRQIDAINRRVVRKWATASSMTDMSLCRVLFAGVMAFTTPITTMTVRAVYTRVKDEDPYSAFTLATCCHTSWATCVATCVATCGQCESTITSWISSLSEYGLMSVI